MGGGGACNSGFAMMISNGVLSLFYRNLFSINESVEAFTNAIAGNYSLFERSFLDAYTTGCPS